MGGGPSVSAFVRGPLVHTPQGLVVVLFSAAYLACAAAVAAGVEPPLGWRPFKVIGFGLFWPLVLFIQLVRMGFPSYHPSWRTTAWLGVWGIAPLAFALWRV